MKIGLPALMGRASASECADLPLPSPNSGKHGAGWLIRQPTQRVGAGIRALRGAHRRNAVARQRVPGNLIPGRWLSRIAHEGMGKRTRHRRRRGPAQPPGWRELGKGEAPEGLRQPVRLNV